MRRLSSIFLLLIVVTPLSAEAKRRAASPDRCSVSVAPAALSFPGSGGRASLSVTVTGGCAWSAVASDSWISASPAGEGITVEVGANSATSSRSGLIHVRGAVVLVTQAGSPVPNLLVNGSFNTSLSGWSHAFSAGGSADWGTLAPAASPSTSSGAAQITSTDPMRGYQLSQCVAVTGGKTYDLGVKVLIPAGQAYGVINFAAYEYWVPNCEVSAGYHGKTELSASAPLGSWFDQTITRFSDFGTRSILVVIGAGGSPNPPFSAWFDEVYVHPRP